MCYLPWVDEWARAKLSGTQFAVMLKLASRAEYDEEGNATAWYPAQEIAEELGITTKAVNKAVASLKKAGMLELKEKAHHSRCAVYRIMPGHPWPLAKVPPAGVPKEGKDTTKQALKLPPPVVPLIKK